MNGRHRKPPRYSEFFHYAGWAVFWVLLVVLVVLLYFMIKGVLT